MFKRLLIAFAATVTLLAADAPLTNDDVVKLSKAGLSAETIVAKIRASESKFDTSTDALVALADAGVADAVIREMVEKKPAVSTKAKPAPSKATAKRKRFEEITVVNASGGRCEHATLELTAGGMTTSGCHESDVTVDWKDVTRVCPLYASRSTLAITTSAGERRLHTTTPAELKALVDAIRAFAPATNIPSACTAN